MLYEIRNVSEEKLIEIAGYAFGEEMPSSAQKAMELINEFSECAVTDQSEGLTEDEIVYIKRSMKALWEKERYDADFKLSASIDAKLRALRSPAQGVVLTDKTIPLDNLIYSMNRLLEWHHEDDRAITFMDIEDLLKQAHNVNADLGVISIRVHHQDTDTIADALSETSDHCDDNPSYGEVCRKAAEQLQSQLKAYYEKNPTLRKDGEIHS